MYVTDITSQAEVGRAHQEYLGTFVLSQPWSRWRGSQILPIWSRSRSKAYLEAETSISHDGRLTAVIKRLHG